MEILMRVIFGMLLSIVLFGAPAVAAEPYILVDTVTYQSTQQGVPPNGIACPTSQVTKLFREKCDLKQSCKHDYVHPTTLCTDPGGGEKRLRIFYSCNWLPSRNAVANPGVKAVPGSDELIPVKLEIDATDGGIEISCRGVVPTPITASRIQILSAVHGAGGKECKFDTLMSKLCNDKSKCSYKVDNELCPGDPNPGIAKVGRVVYECRYPWYSWPAGAAPPTGFPPQLVPEKRTVSPTDGQEMTLSCE
jgi:hypothetical protein